jgi:hypothetical protein
VKCSVRLMSVPFLIAFSCALFSLAEQANREELSKVYQRTGEKS